MLFRFILVNLFSFIKRFFAFNATIYNAIVVVPLLTVLTPRLSKNSLWFVLFFSIFLIVSGNAVSYGKFIVYFLLLISIPMFRRTNFDELMQSTIVFFLLVSMYGLYQKFFGYTSIEVNWIQSGLSFADEREFITDDIRPFSTFASMPEFTMFIALYVFYFTTQKKWIWLLFSFFMLYVAGSRGVFVAVLIAYFFSFIIGRYSRLYLFLSFLSSLLIFLLLIFVFPLVFGSVDTESRMLAYGTFNGRVELLSKVLNDSSFSYLFTGLNIEDMGLVSTFDNIYFMLVAHFGLFGCIIFLVFFLKERIDKKNFYFFSVFLGYGFYADMIFSYYLMFLFFFAIYSSISEERLDVLSRDKAERLSLN